MPVARPDRLPLALPHRDARHRHHERALRRLGPVARRRSRRAPTARWSPTARASPRRTRSSTSRSAALLFIPAGTPGLRGHGRRRVLARRRPRRERLPREEAHQHARLRPRRGRAPRPAPRDGPRGRASSGSTTTSWSRSRPTRSACASASGGRRSGPRAALAAHRRAARPGLTRAGRPRTADRPCSGRRQPVNPTAL